MYMIVMFAPHIDITINFDLHSVRPPYTDEQSNKNKQHESSLVGASPPT